MHAHHSTPQLREELWEELPEDAMRQSRTLPPEEVIYQRLDAALHPALRSNFKIQENWDTAPEMVSPMMTGANPQAAAFLPLSGEPADEDPRDQTAHGKRRRRRSRVPSPELDGRHRHRRHHHRGDSNDLELDSPLKEEPRHGHRRHRRHRSRTSEAKADSSDIVVERHTEDEIPIRRQHYRSERRRSKTPEDRADSDDVISDGHTGSGKHSRHVHFRSDTDADANEHKHRRSGHRKSSRPRSSSRSRVQETRHGRDDIETCVLPGDHEATTTHRRHHRRHSNRRPERETKS